MRDHAPIYSYEPEAQDIATKMAQSKPWGLLAVKRTFLGYEVVKEAGVSWVVVRYPLEESHFYLNDCNLERFAKLKPGYRITSIESVFTMPHIFDNRPNLLVALLTHRQSVLYRSGGFDLRFYRKNGLLQRE